MTTKKRNLSLVLVAVPVVALAAAAVYGAKMMTPPPSDLDYSRTRASEAGAFTATIEPGIDPIAINQMHSWTVEVTMADGSPVAPEAITVDGGMPQHGHGLPTKPEVTENLGDGRFSVEGMKFNMPGWWVVNIHVQTPGGEDRATFNLSL